MKDEKDSILSDDDLVELIINTQATLDNLEYMLNVLVLNKDNILKLNNKNPKVVKIFDIIEKRVHALEELEEAEEKSKT